MVLSICLQVSVQPGYKRLWVFRCIYVFISFYMYGLVSLGHASAKTRVIFCSAGNTLGPQAVQFVHCAVVYKSSSAPVLPLDDSVRATSQQLWKPIFLLDSVIWTWEIHCSWRYLFVCGWCSRSVSPVSLQAGGWLTSCLAAASLGLNKTCIVSAMSYRGGFCSWHFISACVVFLFCC